MLFLVIVVAIATVVACEVALRLPLVSTVSKLTGAAKRAMKVVRSPNISDIWKEKMVPIYAGRIMTASLVFFACLVAIALPAVLIASLATGSLAAGSALLMQPLYLLEMVVVGAGYIWLRTKRSAKA